MEIIFCMWMTWAPSAAPFGPGRHSADRLRAKSEVMQTQQGRMSNHECQFDVFMNFVDNFKSQNSQRQAASLSMSPSEAWRQSVSSRPLNMNSYDNEQEGFTDLLWSWSSPAWGRWTARDTPCMSPLAIWTFWISSPSAQPEHSKLLEHLQLRQVEPIISQHVRTTRLHSH